MFVAYFYLCELKCYRCMPKFKKKVTFSSLGTISDRHSFNKHLSLLNDCCLFSFKENLLKFSPCIFNLQMKTFKLISDYIPKIQIQNLTFKLLYVS